MNIHFYREEDKLYTFDEVDLLDIWELPINPYSLLKINKNYLYDIKKYLEEDGPIPELGNIEITELDEKEYNDFIDMYKNKKSFNKVSHGALKYIYKINTNFYNYQIPRKVNILFKPEDRALLNISNGKQTLKVKQPSEFSISQNPLYHEYYVSVNKPVFIYGKPEKYIILPGDYILYNYTLSTIGAEAIYTKFLCIFRSYIKGNRIGKATIHYQQFAPLILSLPSKKTTMNIYIYSNMIFFSFNQNKYALSMVQINFPLCYGSFCIRKTDVKDDMLRSMHFSNGNALLIFLYDNKRLIFNGEYEEILYEKKLSNLLVDSDKIIVPGKDYFSSAVNKDIAENISSYLEGNVFSNINKAFRDESKDITSNIFFDPPFKQELIIRTNTLYNRKAIYLGENAIVSIEKESCRYKNKLLTFESLQSLTIRDLNPNTCFLNFKYPKLEKLEISRSKITNKNLYDHMHITYDRIMGMPHNYSFEKNKFPYIKYLKLSNLEKKDEQTFDTDSIGNLTTLTSLKISKIPVVNINFTDRLKNLTKLKLNSALIVEFPRVYLPNLTKLSVNHNGIRNINNIVELTSLRTLKIIDNSLKNINGISRLVKLTRLDVECDETVVGLENLPNLTYLRVKMPQYTAGLTDLMVLTRLRTLIIEKANLDNYNLKEILFDKPLLNLALLECNMEDKLEFIKDIKTLRYLDLYDSKTVSESLSDDVTDYFMNKTVCRVAINPSAYISNKGRFLDLVVLNLKCIDPRHEMLVKFSKPILNWISTLSNLTDLSLTNSILDNLDFIIPLTQIRILDISYTKTKNIWPLTKLQKLEYLNLTGNVIESNTLPFKFMRGLKILVVKECYINDDDPNFDCLFELRYYITDGHKPFSLPNCNIRITPNNPAFYRMNNLYFKTSYLNK